MSDIGNVFGVAYLMIGLFVGGCVMADFKASAEQEGGKFSEQFGAALFGCAISVAFWPMVLGIYWWGARLNSEAKEPGHE